MLVQDTLTGVVHEVPESQLYEADYAESPEQMAEGQMLYDGLGNPVGFSFLKRAFRAATRLAPLASLLAGPWSRSPDPGGPTGASRYNTPIRPGGTEAATRASARSGAAVCSCGAGISAGGAGCSATGNRRRLLRGGRSGAANTCATDARAADAGAGLATAAGLDSPSISLPGQEGSSYLFAMRFLAWSKGFGARGCRTGATCAGSRCPDAGARRRGARSHGTAICSPPPALVQRPNLRRQVYAQESDK